MAGSTWDAAAGRPAVPHRFGGQPGPLGCGDCCGTEDQSQDRHPLAPAVRPTRLTKPVADCCGSRPQAHLWAGQDQGRRRGHPAYQAAGDDAVELPAHGRQPRDEQVDDQQHLAQPQPQAAPGQDVQVVSRSPVPGETQRCRRSLSQSPAGSDCAVRGREEPNSSPRSDPAWFALKEGTLRHDDP